MADYGVKTSQVGASVLDATGVDILMTTKFPFAKIDPTHTDSFRSTTITFLNNTADDTITSVYSFPHGYDYKPQVWGYWSSIVWGAGIGVGSEVWSGYGWVWSTTGVPIAELGYDVDETNVNVYAYWSDPFGMNPLDFTGTVATLTTYIFADDLTEQDYND